MNLEHQAWRLLRGSALALGAALLAMPAAANVNIPEGRAVDADGVSIIHIRVLDGCDGQPTDRVEVAIPEPVDNVTPEAIPGWTIEVEAADSDEAEPTAAVEDDGITVVRWTGGPLPAGQFMEFGMRAYFPDEVGTTLAFPVVLGCGLTEIRWDGEQGSDNPAPQVTIGEQLGQRDLDQLAETVAAMSEEVAGLADQLTGVSPSNVRDRVSEVEDRIPDLVERIQTLSDRIDALEGQDTSAANGGDGDG
jgi:uncharacterized protein YcnI